MPSSAPRLDDLRGLRDAPQLAPAERQTLGLELAEAMAPYAWFTLGVMAPNAARALAALRSCEAAQGWPPLVEQPPAIESPENGDTSGADAESPVFLKGNQRSGSYRIRPESGLGEGILISGHHAEDPSAGETWGPLPLDFFLRADA